MIPGGGDLWQLYAVTPPALPTNPITTYTYGYTDSEWGDLLTSYRGQSITYDEIGNPLSYYNGTRYTFTWTGRQLTGAVKGSNTYSFTYNDEGIRTSKTVNGVTTTYYLNGSQILGEETNGNVTVYVYDESGLPIGMQYHASTYAEDVWDIYWYDKNLQGDIVAVYAQDGTKVVSYKYDAWGACTTSTYVSGTAASNNPFKYRGYYYDKDLGLYYLNTRYYDAAVKRFINADSALYHSMLGYNMFAYCTNNPVNYVDYYGEYAEAAIEISEAVIAYGWTIALAEPTIIGEVIYGIAAIGALSVICLVSLSASEAEKSENDAPQSITEPSSDSDEQATDNKPSNPGKMQKEVEKGQAPKDVDFVDKPHNTKTGKPHVHFKDGTAMNNDGTIHDKHKGTPTLTKKVKDWLGKHNWPTEIKFFP